jgi:hypothetical protein
MALQLNRRQWLKTSAYTALNADPTYFEQRNILIRPFEFKGQY